MAVTTKKFLDSAGTSYLWSKIKAALDEKAKASDLTALSEKVGTLPSGKTDLVTWISAIEDSGYDDTALAARVTANENDIDALQATHAKVGGDGADKDNFKTVAQEVTAGITALNLSSTYAGKAYETKVDTLIGDDANKSVRTIANEELAARLIPDDADEALDTLQEIADWIQDHPGDAAAMNTSITTINTTIGSATTADKAGTGLTKRIEDLEAVDHSHSNKDLLDTYTQTEANLADAVSKKHSHSNADVLDGITAAKVSAWDAKQDAIAANTYDAYGAAATAKSEVIGSATDGASATTIYGVKAYADSLAINYDEAGAATAVYDAIIALTNAEIDTAIANASAT